MSIENFSLGKTLWLRFLRGGIAGAVAAMTALQIAGAHSFADLQAFLYSLGVAGIIGFITGGLLALDKYIRAE